LNWASINFAISYHIGANIADYERPQSIIFSTIVCLGFEFEDYIPGKGSDLIQKWPEAEKRIRQLGLTWRITGIWPAIMRQNFNVLANVLWLK